MPAAIPFGRGPTPEQVKTYACVYLGSALVAIAGTPIVTRLAKSRGLLDTPGLRKIHTQPVPRMGGIAIVAAMLMLVLPVLALDNVIGKAFREVQWRVIALLTAGVFVFFVGLVDDIRNVRAKTKLLCLIGAATVVCVSGSRIDSIAAAPLFEWELGWASWPMTILWIVGVTVAMNFMDGLDGLAAGIAAIVCAVITVMAFHNGQLVMGVLMLALLGSLTGFLFYNFNPAKIFMGDCGSMFLGFVIGAGSVVCAAKKTALLGIVVPALALGVPILDAAFTMIRRGILDRRSIFTAERGHIHHRLLDKGLRHRNVVLIIYGATFLAAGVSMSLLLYRSLASLAIFAGAVVFLLLLFHFVGVARLGETVGAIRRNAAIARGNRHDKSCFEDAQLRVREAKSFDGWWRAITGLAEEMDFERVALSVNDGQSSGQTSVWRRSGSEVPFLELVHVTIPIDTGNGNPVSWFEVAVQRNGSLEVVGRRMMYFGRLIDECAVSVPGALRTVSPPPPSVEGLGAAAQRPAVTTGAGTQAGTAPPAVTGK